MRKKNNTTYFQHTIIIINTFVGALSWCEKTNVVESCGYDIDLL